MNGNIVFSIRIETIASEISEEQLKEAIELAHKEVQNIIKEQLGCLQIGDKSIDSTNEFSQDVVSSSSIAAIAYNGFDLTADLKAVAMRMAYDRAYAVYFTPDETDMISIGDRSRSEGKLRAELLREIESVTEFNDQHLIIRQLAVDYVMNKAFRDAVLTNGKRVDGRTTTKLREISSYSDVLPTVHGSSYFKRGDTHVLCTTTLGPKSEAKSLRPINGMREDSEEYFFLHYDFPPYCTGELGLASGLNRRMIGHGNLAERALRPVMPSIHIFPYTVRLFAECTSSNGSSSMASACAATLALMDAGVPISSPVAGVSVGLITDDSSLQSSTTGDGATVDTYSNYKLLKDILGSEDHHGDMDFKIAGTTTGVTAIQLDVKLDGGVPLSLLIEALEVARLGRLEILESINQCIPQHRSTVKPHAPHAAMIQFNPEMIEAVLGQRGQIIKLIQEKCDCEIDTTEEGEAYVFGSNADLVQEAKELIEDLVMTVKENDTATAEVVDVKDFGVVVKVNRAKEGILHISQFSHDPQITHVQLPELLQIGMKFPVKVNMYNIFPVS